MKCKILFLSLHISDAENGAEKSHEETEERSDSTFQTLPNARPLCCLKALRTLPVSHGYNTETDNPSDCLHALLLTGIYFYLLLHQSFCVAGFRRK